MHLQKFSMTTIYRSYSQTHSCLFPIRLRSTSKMFPFWSLPFSHLLNSIQKDQNQMFLPFTMVLMCLSCNEDFAEVCAVLTTQEVSSFLLQCAV